MNEIITNDVVTFDLKAASSLNEEALFELKKIEKTPGYFCRLGLTFLLLNNFSHAGICFKIALEYSDKLYQENIIARLGLIKSSYELDNHAEALEQLNAVNIHHLFNADISDEFGEIILDLLNKTLPTASRCLWNKESSKEVQKIAMFNISMVQIMVHIMNMDYFAAKNVIADMRRETATLEENTAVLFQHKLNNFALRVWKEELMEQEGDLELFLVGNGRELLELVSFLNEDENYFVTGALDAIIGKLFQFREFQFINTISERFTLKINFISFYTLFAFAFSAGQNGNKEKAKALYEIYLQNYEPTSSVCNNLGVVYQDENVDRAIELFNQAIDLNPEDSLNYFNLGKALILKEQYSEALKIIRKGQKLSPDDSRIKPLIQKLPKLFNNYIPDSHLVREQQDKLNEYYWCTDIKTDEIKKRFRLEKNARSYFSYLIYPYRTCPNCDANLIYKSRTSKLEGTIDCEICVHQETKSNRCTCDYCRKVYQEFIEKQQAEKRKREEQEYKERVKKASTPEFLKWAISRLGRKEKLFARTLYELLENGGDTSWKNICEQANLDTPDKYIKKLVSLSLLFINLENRYVINEAVRSDMIEILEEPPKPAENYPSDNHLPGNQSYEKWKENMRQKREETLVNRLERLDEVIEYWLKCRGYRYLSTYDEKFINSFIRKYEPEWIMKAIKIASEKRINDCGKYVAGILKNWLENGYPEDEINLKLAYKPATDNQISFVKSLLEINKITLPECCGKFNLHELSMLDAKNIIGELSSKL